MGEVARVETGNGPDSRVGASESRLAPALRGGSRPRRAPQQAALRAGEPGRAVFWPMTTRFGSSARPWSSGALRGRVRHVGHGDGERVVPSASATMSAGPAVSRSRCAALPRIGGRPLAPPAGDGWSCVEIGPAQVLRRGRSAGPTTKPEQAAWRLVRVRVRGAARPDDTSPSGDPVRRDRRACHAKRCLALPLLEARPACSACVRAAVPG